MIDTNLSLGVLDERNQSQNIFRVESHRSIGSQGLGLFGHLALRRVGSILRIHRLELVVSGGELEGESSGKLPEHLSLFEILDEEGLRKSKSESSTDLFLNLRSESFGRQLLPLGVGIRVEG